MRTGSFSFAPFQLSSNVRPRRGQLCVGRPGMVGQSSSFPPFHRRYNSASSIFFKIIFFFPTTNTTKDDGLRLNP